MSDAELRSRLAAKVPEYADLTKAQVVWDDEAEKVVQAYFDVVEAEMKVQRRSLLGRGLLAWLVPCVGLYVFGWAIRWVYQGFKSDRATRLPEG